MKTIVAVIVHDRIDNIKLWVNAWKQCEQEGAELVIIQNDSGNKDEIKNYCDQNEIKYISRKNIGYDIGAFQDVCKERLQGFDNDWDVLLWCTDDTLPMRKDFLDPYLKKIHGGVACTYLSSFVKKHIRTTGFAITKQASKKIQFEKDPVTTKEDCYQFEHRSSRSFYEQMIRQKVPVIQVASWAKSVMWDSGYNRVVNRMKEHLKVFEDTKKPEPKRSKKVAFICPAYNSYPQIISSLICQTHKDWELFILHDGPNTTGLKELITDPRIHYQETPERTGNWGHHLRQWALKNLKELCPDADYVVITNADNYHVPVYTEYLVKALENNPTAVAAYCSDMVHNYKAWQIIPCRLQLGFIDCGGVMVKKEVACQVGWRDIESHSSDWTYFSDIIEKYGAARWTKVAGCLLIHN